MRNLFNILYAALLALLLLPVAACADDGSLIVRSASGDHAFRVEVVDTPEGRAKGLMFRTELAPNSGMLFDFKQSGEVSFWMRNTLIPLDMIFIKSDGRIANIHVNAIPQDPTGIPSAGPVMFVLEIPGGRSVELGLKPGDRVIHRRITGG